MYQCNPASLVTELPGKSFGWNGLWDGTADDYYSETCSEAGGPGPSGNDPPYSLQISTGAWADPIQTRDCGGHYPDGTAFRIPALDRFTGDETNIQAAYANVQISDAVHTITNNELAVHSSTPGGWTELLGLSDGRTWDSRVTSVDTSTFDVALALFGYISNGDGTYFEVLLGGVDVGGDLSTGYAKVNCTGVVKAYLELGRHYCSFFRWFALPPNSVPVDPTLETSCDSYKAAYERVDPTGDMTGFEDTGLTNPLTGNNWYIHEGEYADYSWTWSDIGVSLMSVSTDGGEIAQSSLVQTQFIQASVAPNA